MLHASREMAAAQLSYDAEPRNLVQYPAPESMPSSIMPVANETKASIKRITSDGRELLYELEVIQQPERARACGSGAKSSADRRPVDPPPVIELHIYEGEERNDVTFSHDANFFLFTTLEHARPIAQGRVPQTQSTLAALTGSPVAGVAYLDRPKPAGYFIFPDLSVRHEGKYRLVFSLYEQLKEAKDADSHPPEGSPNTRERMLRDNPMLPRAFVHFRLEVKSTPFSVFSAKKFPGLAESTSLSRLVAEQGCRVRIRRDVRMRRRDKVPDSYQDMDDESRYARSDRFSTPQQMPDRPRSVSNASMDASTPYSMGRAPSIHDITHYGQPNFHQPPPPLQTHSANSYASHLSFGGSSTPTYQTPTMPGPPPPMPQNYMQPSNGFPYSTPSHTRQMSVPQYGYAQVQQQQQQQQQQAYPQPQHFLEDTRAMPDHRRNSVGMATTRQSPATGFESYAYSHSVPQQQTITHQPAPRSITPMSTSSQEHPMLPPVSQMIQQTAVEPKIEPASAVNYTPPGPSNPYTPNFALPNYQPPYTSTKRSYDNVFETSHFSQPLHSGMRPSSAHHAQDITPIEADDAEIADAYDELGQLKGPLIYKRADGTRQAKRCPNLKDPNVRDEPNVRDRYSINIRP